MPTLFAQKLNIPGITGTIEGPKGFKPEFTNLSSVITQIIPILFSVAGIFLLVFLLWGGLEYMLSMGDPKKAEKARGKITSAIIGFVIIFASYWIVQLIDYIFRLGIYT
jgi:hypothetical protein